MSQLDRPVSTPMTDEQIPAATIGELKPHGGRIENCADARTAVVEGIIARATSRSTSKHGDRDVA